MTGPRLLGGGIGAVREGGRRDLYATVSSTVSGGSTLRCGDLERALDLNRQAAEGGRKRGDPEMIANAELNLGDIFLAQGDLALAQEFLEGVYRLVARSGDQRVDAVALLDPPLRQPGGTLACSR